MNFILPTLKNAGLFDFIALRGNKQSELRLTNQFEIELPIEVGGYSYINGATYQITNNKLLCIKPHMKRYTIPPFKCYYIHLSVNEGKIYDFLSCLPDVLPITNPFALQSLFLEIIEAFHHSDTEEIKLYRLILELFSIIKEELKKNTKSKPHKILEKVISYIEEHISQKITLNDLGNVVGYNPIYLHRIFKQQMNCTPLDYVISHRIKKAKTQLCLTDKSILEIAEETGFCTQSYFNLIFKKQTGCTPTQYRKNYYQKYSI